MARLKCQGIPEWHASHPSPSSAHTNAYSGHVAPCTTGPMTNRAVSLNCGILDSVGGHIQVLFPI
jgi:hypothetical protein